MKHISKLSSRLLALLLLGAFSSVWAQDSVELQTGVLVDTSRDTIYLMTPQGSITAHNIADGKKVWETSHAAKPLGLMDGKLLAQKDAAAGDTHVELLLFDVRDRNSQPQRVQMPVPAGSWNRVDDGMGTSFRVNTAPWQGEFAIWWQSSERKISGIASVSPPQRKQEGAFMFDQGAGELSTPANLPAAPDRRVLRLAPGSARVAGSDGVRYLSADERNTLHSERIANNDVWEPYRWTFYNNGNGEKLGSLTEHFSTANIQISGDKVIYVARPYLRLVNDQWTKAELRVRVFDLTKGVEVWQQPIRDITYRGPFPK